MSHNRTCIQDPCRSVLMMDALLPIPLTPRTVHLCVDMQRVFSSEGPWSTPWMERVLPIVLAICRRFPERTVFTRFITPWRAEDMPGTWNLYYKKWRQTTREHLDIRLLQLMPDLVKLAPPATVIDKTRYSAFFEPFLLQHLRDRQADGLIVTGSETDVCVLATIMGAVDHGYRVILVRDGVCSSSDEGHDALLELYHRRFSAQIETADAETILSRWA
jgi:nicotinamidase-related amidase